MACNLQSIALDPLASGETWGGFTWTITSSDEYPISGQWGVHKNTSSGDVFLAYNDGGIIKKVQLT